MRLLFRLAILIVCGMILMSEVRATDFGTNAASGGSRFITAGYVSFLKYTMPAGDDGICDSIYVYGQRGITAGPDTMWVGVFSDNSNYPNARLFQTRLVFTDASSSWKVAPITLTLSASTAYWLALGAGTSSNSPKVDTTGSATPDGAYTFRTGAGQINRDTGFVNPMTAGASIAANNAALNYIVYNASSPPATTIDFANRHSPTNIGIRHNPGGIGLRHKP